MRFAAIDIGTNSTRLLISERINSTFITIAREMEITRIGKDLQDSGMISKEAAEATIKVISRYKKTIDK